MSIASGSTWTPVKPPPAARANESAREPLTRLHALERRLRKPTWLTARPGRDT
jgi:hypothetical protein